MARDYDLYVIGAGSGGVRAARIASSLGARVAIAEADRVGGTCVIRGCIPKKLMVFASHIREDVETAAGYGWRIPPADFDWPGYIQAKDREIERLNRLYLNTLENAHVTLHRGKARLVDRHTVEVGGNRHRAEKILIAVGGRPWMPPVPGIEHAISSDEVFDLDRLPPRILIVGGGYIAVEFAGIFNGMGSAVTLAYRGERILRGFDQDLRERLTQEMRAKGIDLRLNSEVAAIALSADGTRRVTLADGQVLAVDQLLYATGRTPNTSGLGLRQVGVELNGNGGVRVDAYSRTSVAPIFAVGDVTDRIALTPVAIKEGHAFALTAFGKTPTPSDHDTVPTAVFSQPPIATVGLTEEQARQRFDAVDVYASDFRPLRHTLGGSPERAFTKLLVDPATDRVVGAHMIGIDAPEIIQGLAIAVKAGVTKAQIDATVAIHPSTAEEFVLMREKRGG